MVSTSYHEPDDRWRKRITGIKNLTSGKTTIVSFPLEDEEETIQEDFTSMGINYSQLPDLHVGDGEIQIVVANADLPKVESWYKLYRNDLLNEGVTDIPDMKRCQWTTICRQDSRQKQNILIQQRQN